MCVTVFTPFLGRSQGNLRLAQWLSRAGHIGGQVQPLAAKIVMRSVLDFSLIAIGIDYKCSVVKDRPAAEKGALRNEKSRQG